MGCAAAGGASTRVAGVVYQTPCSYSTDHRRRAAFIRTDESRPESGCRMGSDPLDRSRSKSSVIERRNSPPPGSSVSSPSGPPVARHGRNLPYPPRLFSTRKKVAGKKLLESVGDMHPSLKHVLQNSRFRGRGAAKPSRLEPDTHPCAVAPGRAPIALGRPAAPCASELN